MGVMKIHSFMDCEIWGHYDDGDGEDDDDDDGADEGVSCVAVN